MTGSDEGNTSRASCEFLKPEIHQGVSFPAIRSVTIEFSERPSLGPARCDASASRSIEAFRFESDVSRAIFDATTSALLRETSRAQGSSYRHINSLNVSLPRLCQNVINPTLTDQETHRSENSFSKRHAFGAQRLNLKTSSIVLDLTRTRPSVKTMLCGVKRQYAIHRQSANTANIDHL